jgi:hypothetical protein
MGGIAFVYCMSDWGALMNPQNQKATQDTFLICMIATSLDSVNNILCYSRYLCSQQYVKFRVFCEIVASRFRNCVL